MNNILVIILIVLIIYVISNKTTVSDDNEIYLPETEKYKMLYPSVKKDIKKFMFNIQDMYERNPSEYGDMIENINTFFQLYERTKMNKEESFNNYELMVVMKKKVLNNISSFTFSKHLNQSVIDKIDLLIEEIETLLNKYLKDIAFIQDNYVYKNGYNVNIHFRNSIPAFNEFNQYEVY